MPYPRVVNVVYCSNTIDGYSRFELVQWLNYLLSTDFEHVEDMCTGAAYCQLFDMLFRGSIPMTKVKFDANQEYYYMKNFKLLQDAFERHDVTKMVPITILIKGRFQANLEFLQWFRRFFEANCTERTLSGYDPVKARKGCDFCMVTRIAESVAPKQKTKRMSPVRIPPQETITLHLTDDKLLDSESVSCTTLSTERSFLHERPTFKTMSSHEHTKHEGSKHSVVSCSKAAKSNSTQSIPLQSPRESISVKTKVKFSTTAPTKKRGVSVTSVTSCPTFTSVLNKSHKSSTLSASKELSPSSSKSDIRTRPSRSGHASLKRSISALGFNSSDESVASERILKKLDQLNYYMDKKCAQKHRIEREINLYYSRLVLLEKLCLVNQGITNGFSERILEIIYESEEGPSVSGIIPKM